MIAGYNYLRSSFTKHHETEHKLTNKHELITMSPNTDLVSAIEALLTEAKSYNEENPDRVTRASMLEKVEALHYRLESPEEAMFRQLTNVGLPRQFLMEGTNQEQVFGNLSGKDIASNGGSGQDTPR
jgi:hypothetical protein